MLDAGVLARGNEIPSTDGLIPIPHHDFSIARGELDGLGHMATVEMIVEGIWEIEETLCGKEISRLPGHEVTSEMARMIGRGDVTGFFVRLRLDTKLAGLDTMVLDSARLQDVRRECPGLVAKGPHPGILQDGPFTVAAHDDFAGQVAMLSSRFGPMLVQGPTVIHCGDSGIGIRHYCLARGPQATRPRGLVGGIVILPQPAP